MAEIWPKLDEISYLLIQADAADEAALADLGRKLGELTELCAGHRPPLPPEVSALVTGLCPALQVRVEQAPQALADVSRAVTDLQAMLREVRLAEVAAARGPDSPRSLPRSARSGRAGRPRDGDPLSQVGEVLADREDREMIAEFVTEAKEHLESVDRHLLLLESDPHRQESLNALFRAFHSIKGIASFFDLFDITTLAHEAENLLDQARAERLTITGPRLELTFSSADTLKRLVDQVADTLANRSRLRRDPALKVLITGLREAIASAPGNASPPSSPASLPLSARVAAMSGPRPARPEHPAGVPMSRPMTPPAVLPKSSRPGHLIPDPAAEPGAGPGPGGPSVEVVLRDSPPYPADLTATAATADFPGLKLEGLSVRSRPRRPPELAPEKPDVPEKVEKADPPGKPGKPGPVNETIGRETVRVDRERLDKLVDAIGELVIAESMVHQEVLSKTGAMTGTSRTLSHLYKITRGLQELSLSLRMVPLRGTIEKTARLVRDLSRKIGKEIEFVSEGEDTELDKTVVDQIGDPLVHMIRNSIDHGIEPKEQRLAAGKSARGRVAVRAFHRGGSIYIEVSDDGRGLDRTAILAKARERGLIRDDDTLSDREVYNLIFLPGFSTAKQVTDVSGRGVGMDVVKRNIESLRGAVELRSEPGKGSTISVRLPLTLAIIDGMVVRVGGNRYVIPTSGIVELLRPHPSDISTVAARGEILSVRGQMVPLFRLGSVFRADHAETDPTRGTVVVVEDNHAFAALLVDEIVGQQQVVIKNLGLDGLQGLAGAAVMPDGRVGLIIDTHSLLLIARSGRGAA